MISILKKYIIYSSKEKTALAEGKDLKEARTNAYEATKWVQFDNKYMRNDIGKAIDELQEKCKNGDYKELGFTEEFDEQEVEFLKTQRTISDFDIGLKEPDKLLPKRITGGVLLVNTYYEMR